MQLMKWNDGAEIVDGKSYALVAGEIVEIAPRKVECQIGGETVEFIENGEYENHFGVYRVWMIRDDGTMDVEYIRVKISTVSVGDWKNYSVKAQAEAVFNERRRVKAQMGRIGVRIIGKSEMFTLGYVMSVGTIVVHTNKAGMDRFAEKYEAVTGVKPVRPTEGNRANWYVDESYWGVLGIQGLEGAEDETLAKLSLPNICVCKNGAVAAWNTRYVWSLLAMGLRIGRNDGRVNDVAGKLSPEDQEKFLEGVRAGRGEMAIAA